MATYLYHRLRVTSAANGNSSENTPVCAEWKLYDASNTQISTSGATFSATSFYTTGYEADKAFDANSSTFWNAASNPSVGSPQSLQVQFVSAVAPCDHFTIQTRNDSLYYQGPATFAYEVSNDGSAWSTIFNYDRAVWMSAGETKTFYTSGIVYRFKVTAVQGGSSNSVSIANLKLYDPSSTLLSTSTGTAMANGAYSAGGDPNNAFAGSSALMWRSYTTLASMSPAALEFHFPTVVVVGSFSFQSPSALPGGVAETPTSLVLQKSTDGLNFTDVQTYTTSSWTSGGQTQTFTAPTSTASISPTTGTQGGTYLVAVTGSGSSFVAGVTTVSISGSGATVSAVSVGSNTSLSFLLAVSATAAAGARTVTITTGSEVFTATFTVALGAENNLAWLQIRVGDRAGTGAQGQSTDGTAAPGTFPMVSLDGSLTASTIVVSSLATPGIVLLASQTGSGVAELDFTTRSAGGALFQSDFDVYEICVVGLIPATNGANAQIQFSTNGGASWDTSGSYDWGHVNAQIGTAGSGSNGQANAAAIILFADSSGGGTANTALPGLNGTFRVYDPLSTTYHKNIAGLGQANYSGNGNRYMFSMGGVYKSTSAANAFRLMMSSGNITARVRVFGVAK